MKSTEQLINNVNSCITYFSCDELCDGSWMNESKQMQEQRVVMFSLSNQL